MSSEQISPIESQYKQHFNDIKKYGPEILGTMAAARWRNDPKLLGITLSRYKFVSKMLKDFNLVLEIGAGDSWFSRVVLESCQKLVLSDFDPIWKADFSKQEFYKGTNTEYIIHNFVVERHETKYDGIYALDVLEHIKPSEQDQFLQNVCRSLNQEGVAIFGMPSLESQLYASKSSKEGHVNCQSGEQLREGLKKYFENVFIFSMSDEVIHTGFTPMAHYLIALCVAPKYF